MSRITAALRALVLERDAMCFLYRLDTEHVCHDAFGNEHSPFDRSKLTLDHVKDQLRMGVRAPSDPAHLVAMCHRGNVDVPSKAVRQAERDYLAAEPGATIDWTAAYDDRDGGHGER